MATYRYIYWRNDLKRDSMGRRFANVHYLVGYNQGTISDFIDMARVIQEAFPEASISDIHCAHVTNSSYCKGFSLVTYNACIFEGEYKDWTQVEPRKDGKSNMEYYWY